MINSNMGYQELCESIRGSAAVILMGPDCINKPEPLMALTVIPDAHSPGDTFAVVFSVSHILCDGHTYYKVLSMFSSNSQVIALNPTRKHEHGAISKQAM